MVKYCTAVVRCPTCGHVLCGSIRAPSSPSSYRPASLTPVLEDNLARTRLPTASCLIGSPCTQTQGGNCSVCTLWFKRGPWFSFVIDSVLWDERRENRAKLCGWLISQCLVGCGRLSMFGLLQACWGDARGCYFWIPQNAWCVSVPSPSRDTCQKCQEIF